ncbi:uncharacterized protein [Onthophagus taurus]|uniref:uncharacterized protein n=1 Tax=Onthophagus taurus TaxID=166361 RepID=UPI000C200742|nr:uncharacterized protein LOC111416350 [Onthophagus taurus]
MFGQLVNYLLGTTNTTTPTVNIRPDQQPPNLSTEPSRVAPLVLEEDDGWLLVDRDSEGNSVGTVDDDDLEDTDLDDLIDPIHDLEDPELDRLVVPSEMTRSESSSSSHAAMEESWYITPPPCFTSTGTVVMETSPLENLLIEHPSISVYRHHPNPQHPHFRILSQQLRERSSEVEDDEDEEVDVVNVEDDFVEIEDRLLWREPVRRRRMRHVDEVLRQQDVQRVRTKSAQRVQIQKACQTLKKGYLERTNKARDVNSRNQRQRRGEKSQGARRSCANNNRKC